MAPGGGPKRQARPPGVGDATHATHEAEAVRVHRNLNRGTWSITEPGQPVRHAEAVTMARVAFRVSLAGRARVLARKCRAVHAWAIGTPTDATPPGPLVRVTYNPFRADSFTRADDGAPIHAAAFVIFTAEGHALAQLEG